MLPLLHLLVRLVLLAAEAAEAVALAVEVCTITKVVVQEYLVKVMMAAMVEQVAMLVLEIHMHLVAAVGLVQLVQTLLVLVLEMEVLVFNLQLLAHPYTMLAAAVVVLITREEQTLQVLVV